MIGAKIRVIASPSDVLPNDLGLPAVYQPYLDQWKSVAEGQIIEAILEDRTDSNWSDLGNHLVHQLLSAEKYAGLSLDGSFPICQLTSWLASEDEWGGKSSISVSYAARPGRHTNVTWNSLHEVRPDSWLFQLWTPLRSEMFHVACDLVLAVFADDVLAALEWDHPIRVQDFGELLVQASGWMIPLDSNLGFLLGVRERIGLWSRGSRESTTASP